MAIVSLFHSTVVIYRLRCIQNILIVHTAAVVTALNHFCLPFRCFTVIGSNIFGTPKDVDILLSHLALVEFAALPGLHVRAVEEPGEEDEVAAVHQQRQLEVGLAHPALHTCKRGNFYRLS